MAESCGMKSRIFADISSSLRLLLGASFPSAVSALLLGDVAMRLIPADYFKRIRPAGGLCRYGRTPVDKRFVARSFEKRLVEIDARKFLRRLEQVFARRSFAGRRSLLGSNHHAVNEESQHQNHQGDDCFFVFQKGVHIVYLTQ